MQAAQGRDWFFFWLFFFSRSLICGLSSDLCVVASERILQRRHLGWRFRPHPDHQHCHCGPPVVLVERFSKFTELLGSITQGLSLVYSPIDIKDKKDAVPLNVTSGAITFQNVRFQYRGEEPLVSK